MTSTNYATIQIGTVTAQGPIIAIHRDGRVCVDAGGHIHCGTPIGRHIPEKVVKPAAASASGHALKAGAALMAAFMAIATPADAYPVHPQDRVCGQLEQVIDNLAQYHGELPMIAGNIDKDGPLNTLVFAMNTESRTWTLMEVRAANLWTCIVAHGHDAGSPWEVQ